MSRTDHRFPIDQLGQLVADALSVDYKGPSNGQIRAVPNRRTIRYYTTLGLLDRPVEMRGRTAFYNRRHLLQLVAIKRLQARGLTLSQVQERLAGIGTAALETLANVPKEVGAVGSGEPEGKVRSTSRRADFWLSPPAAVSAAAHEDEPVSKQPESSGDREQSSVAQPVAYSGVELAPGVSLLIEGQHTSHDLDVVALRDSAIALIAHLTTRGILDPH